MLLFWYPITTSVHEAILHGISERIYSQSVPLALSVTPVLDPITGKYLTSIPKEDTRTAFLDHFAVWELRLWLHVEKGKKQRGVWILWPLLLAEFLLCLGCLAVLIYFAVALGKKSDYFTLLILAGSVMLVVALLQLMRVFATRKLRGVDCTQEEVTSPCRSVFISILNKKPCTQVQAHIEQLCQLYA